MPPVESRDGQAVAVHEPIGGQRREPRSWRQDAKQIERIGAESETHSPDRPTAHLAQEADRLGQRILLAEKPATNRPPRISPRASSRR